MSIADALLGFDRSSKLSLQAQLRERLVSIILSGTLEAGSRVPSSRALAAASGVSRITVTLAYQQLVADGYLRGRERSGFYVADGLATELACTSLGEAQNEQVHWRSRLKNRAPRPRGFRCPPDWRRFPYPFVDGRFDPALYPVNDWREAARLALGVAEIIDWSIDSGEADDPFLIEQIRTKILRRRGIEAKPQEILITMGTQQALNLICELLVERNTCVAIEEPGYPDLHHMLHRRRCQLLHQPVDEQGLIVDDRLDGADLIFTAPSHQFPTAATMSLDRREALLRKAVATDAIIVEDDVDCESNYSEQALPALRALDVHGRVIYTAGLSKILAPALRLGFIVAPSPLLEEFRRLRRLQVRHPPLSNQRTAAFFLSLGHYDAAMLRLCRAFRERQMLLKDALNHYLPQGIEVRLSRGGTAFWVRGPDGVDAQLLAIEAERRGVLIEPVAPYYARDKAPANVFRMSVTSLPADRIRPGVAALASVIRELAGSSAATHDCAEILRGGELYTALAGATILCRTVYGEPFSIFLAADGTMQGVAGYASEDRDKGRWWIEDELWFRHWENWAYGECLGLRTVIEGNEVIWFKPDGRFIDRGVIASKGAVTSF